jgi:alginate O-acetyltransferase complex protein AlgI
VLFNSYEFIFGFLPVCLAVFYLLARLGLLHACATWLTLASLFFYGYWNPKYLLLLGASIAVNFYCGKAISRLRHEGKTRSTKQVLVCAVSANLATLGYFKYANFFVEALGQFTGVDVPLAGIVLPLGISFFTFTQIAFLVDTYHGKASEPRFVPYALFVTYFPHLIAGPVLHHAEMMPQFAEKSTYRFQVENFAIGMAFFLFGLFKKVVLADEVQPFVGPVFDASPGYTLTMLEAWGGALAYTLQLYFDFSGYSDMAIGLSKMFNVDLPLNFNSPYKAESIIEFWRRWHMTLSRFLRDYLYFGLGGNRKGPVRRYSNLLVTMLLGGLWHGAGWTFLVWGGVHGVLLVVNHGWRHFRLRFLGHDLARSTAAGHVLAVFVTFVCVVVAWVFFRATNLGAAMNVLSAMFGANGMVFPIEWQATLTSWVTGRAQNPWRFGTLDAFGGLRQCLWCAVLLGIVFWAPNSQTFIGRFEAALRSRGAKARQWAWCATGFACTLMTVVSAINDSRGVSEFIYFNF